MPVVVNNPPPRGPDGSGMAGWIVGLLIVVVLVVVLIYLLPRIMPSNETNIEAPDINIPENIQIQTSQ